MNQERWVTAQQVSQRSAPPGKAKGSGAGEAGAGGAPPEPVADTCISKAKGSGAGEAGAGGVPPEHAANPYPLIPKV